MHCACCRCGLSSCGQLDRCGQWHASIWRDISTSERDGVGFVNRIRTAAELQTVTYTFNEHNHSRLDRIDCACLQAFPTRNRIAHSMRYHPPHLHNVLDVGLLLSELGLHHAPSNRADSPKATATRSTAQPASSASHAMQGSSSGVSVAAPSTVPPVHASVEISFARDLEASCCCKPPPNESHAAPLPLSMWANLCRVESWTVQLGREKG